MNKIQTKKSLRVCDIGHQYYKSSSCRVCPVCESENKSTGNFLAVLAAPARRALENNGIKTIQQLAKFSENDILRFHGMGKSSIPKLKQALNEKGFSFKRDR